MVIIKVTDGIPVRLHGTKKRGKSAVKFFHKCCDCGLRHDVTIKHDGKSPHVDITFTRIKAVVKEEKVIQPRTIRSASQPAKPIKKSKGSRKQKKSGF